MRNEGVIYLWAEHPGGMISAAFADRNQASLILKVLSEPSEKRNGIRDRLLRMWEDWVRGDGRTAIHHVRLSVDGGPKQNIPIKLAGVLTAVLATYDELGLMLLKNRISEFMAGFSNKIIIA